VRGVDLHDVAAFSGPRLQRLVDEGQRHARGSAVEHGDAGRGRLDLLIRALEQRRVIRAARGVVPERFGVLLVPYLPVFDLRVAGHQIADVGAPQVEMLPRRSRPRHVVIEDGQDGDSLRTGEFHQAVEVGILPFPLFLLGIFPIEIGADPADSGLLHLREGLLGELPFATADMGADGVGVADGLRPGGEGEGRGEGGEGVPKFHHNHPLGW